MRRSIPSRVLLPLAGAGVAVAGAIVLTVVSSSPVLPLALLGLAAAGMALTIAAMTRQVLQPLEDLAALLDTTDAALDDRSGGHGDPVAARKGMATLATRPDAVGRVAAAAVAYADRADALEAEQVAVAKSLATTMSDVARRALSLVNRLLDQLEVLERDETDAARLEQLYALDHLAVRLRGQSEDLLVVADAAPDGDPDEPPMAAVDLVRLAASRAEDYRRVTTDADLPGAIVGWAARPLAQLLSALLDNALRYSPPGQPVVVTGQRVPGGLELRVRDRGIGMDDAALAAAAATVETPPLLEAARSRRLGLYVVGVLARRLGIAVRLTRVADAAGGVEATIRIPVALLDGVEHAPTASARAAEAWGIGDAPPSAASPAVAPPAAASPDVASPAVAPTPVASPSPSVVDLAAELGWDSAPEVPVGGAPAVPDPSPAAPAAPAAAAAAPAAAGTAPGALPPASAPADPHQSEGLPARRRKRRPAASWSIALHEPDGNGHAEDEEAGPDVGFVNDVATWQAKTPVGEAPWLMVDGPSMPSRPVVVPTTPRLPSLDARAHAAEPDDYIPPIIDNPLLDILPEHPTAQLAPVMPQAMTSPIEIQRPTVLDGIRVAGSTPTAAAPAAPQLPSRAPRTPAEDQAHTNLFGGGGSVPSTTVDDPAQFSALAGLAGIDEEGLL